MSTWTGSANLVRTPRVARWGSWYVAEARLREMSKWPGAIISVSFANPVLYLAAVGIGIGSLINVNGIDGVPFLTFLGPALLCAAAIQATTDETLFPTLQGFKWEKTFHATRSTPVTSAQIANGVVLAAAIRAILAVVAYFLVLVAFGAVTSPRAWLAIPIAVIAGLAFGSVMAWVTAMVLNDDSFMSLVNRFVVTPMFLFSGTYYPLDTVPLALQPLGWISPLWHATELGRWASYGHSLSGTMLLIHLTYFIVVLGAGFALAHRQFAKRLES